MASPSEGRSSQTPRAVGGPGGSADGARDRLLAALVALAGDLTVEREERGLLRSALEHVVGALDLEGGLTLLLDESGEPQPVGELHAAVPLSIAVALARDVVARDRPLVREGASGRLAATPLRAGPRTLGVMLLHERAAAEPALDDEGMEAVGKQVGAGLDNLRLYAELRASAARADVLRRVTSAVTSGRDLASVVPVFAAEMAAVLPFERLACGFVNESGDYIEMVSHPVGTAWGLGGVLPIVGSGPGLVALNDRPVVQGDLVHDHRFLEDMKLLDEGLRSYALFPLRAREQTIGVLALGDRRAFAFDDAALARLQPLADSVGLAFENLRLLQRTRELSITDEVTPLHNFRHFHQALDRELKLVHRYGGQLSLLFLDLDRFKPINDTYGHLRGSRTLREVGFLIRAAVRDTDVPARYGGDEFVVILPRTDGEHAKVLAEKMRRLIEGHTFLQEEGIDARLGVSMGVATFPSEAADKEALVRLADKRMYEDKESRRGAR